MERERFKIEYPTEVEMKGQIESIIKKGLQKKQSFPAFLHEMYRHIGWRYVFRDATEVSFLTVIMMSLLVFVLYGFNGNAMNTQLYSLIFTLSPMFYFVIASTLLVHARMKPAFELEMTFKYHVFQLAAFRMLVFSVIGLGLNVVLMTIISEMFSSIHIMEALMLSLCSLSIFGSIHLYSMQKRKGKLVSYVWFSAWIVGNGTLVMFDSIAYSLFLSSVPVYVYAILITLSVYFYIRNLKRLITFRNVEGVL
ncbi:hypothetical protein [Bacillus sp. RO1]|uniref:hypothetical protein n=1 Tax=Bacillus sp. RO1 TaxID=2722703 RepID=UPI001457836D|nr:hypothetical protein [Bacillus sp. RO1]NLP52598.1 hypothetical protein [Bacillus sp. RO1]